MNFPDISRPMPPPGRINYRVVATNEGLDKLLVEIHRTQLVQGPPALYVGLHGPCSNLGRYGTLSVLRIFVAPIKTAFLVDVLMMGIECFRYTSPTTQNSIKGVLESPLIPKVFFNLRNDSNKLYGTCEITIDCVQDLQLMGRACCETMSLFTGATLGSDAIQETDNAYIPAAERKRRAFVQAQEQICQPNPDGNTKLFNYRPLTKESLGHCLRSVIHQPKLLEMYTSMTIPPYRQDMYTMSLSVRLEMTKSPYYSPEDTGY